MDYVFSHDWAEPFRKTAERLFLPMAGRELRYLEIGVYEGRSVLWMIDNVLTHPACRIVCVDFKIQDNCRLNFGITGKSCCAYYVKKNIEFYEGDSKVIVPHIRGEFDIIYIDGDHSAKGCLFDTVASWQLCKAGGIILWDDYVSHDKSNRVSKAVQAFLSCIRHKEYKVIEDGEQFAIQKRHS